METAKERVSKPALPCTPAGIRQPNPLQGRQGNDRDVYRDRICSPGQHSASQQSHRRQLL